ncbi:3-hydroxyacyl-CoA dehydrogenase/enoyl-CoA hydratase family protein [Thermaurantimonas aggregans]|uniref:3-hydroxyacyl-CoA dehydrogenase/enoyl-CoA hydratase family protein n=1 Tax=Thermaurantimonas aggregans TaxID=2173829 RepID=UPI0023F27BA8|nr:3-hydroxyacyl-CoA dehydrogenase/enoyl-CoA hydratase family protein [Thermaurantimonas aggregans]MCX8149761.1 3-hydroxyacyl-CoA dehydrogenase NAD-binding domain-containing protein [Thermaurantimonas aggregans]
MNTPKNRWIRKVAVLGSGIMGSRIALHLANAGIPSLLLDIVPKELTPDEEKKGLTLQSPEVRNRIVNQALAIAVKSNPSPVYSQCYVSRITTGNFEDDFPKIKECDWIIEAVVERLDIKKSIFDQVEKYRKPGSIVSSNTSGIPIHLMAEGRSDDFKRNFLGTHFFNPPRYLPLLEIIPTPYTDPTITDFFLYWGDRFLGKTTVLCKDTPAFIANRVGVFGIMAIFHAIRDMGLTVEEVDKLTGPVLGRPKSATFRTADVVGLDTLVHVANGLYQALPHDEQRELFRLPDFIQKMMENNWLGDKTGQGFYKKVKNADGSSTILSLDLNTLEYRQQKKAKFPTLEQTKTIDNLSDRYKVLIAGQDKAGEFYRKSFAALFSYVAHRIPEISDELYRIDAAMRAGFGWEHGPFEIWDALGIRKGIELTESQGYKVPQWVKDLSEKGIDKFYQTSDGTQQYFDIPSASFKVRPDLSGIIILDHRRHTSTVWSNSECSVIDLGDGILNIEFRSKMNTLGSGVLSGINKGIELAERDFRGVVISNQGANFSVGANLMMVYMMAIEQEYDELNFAIKYFQDTVMRVRYSHVPVVVAPHGMTLGGGCELVLHADAVQAAAETYMGLVEFGVGVIPGGGGTKELTRRSALRYVKDDIELNVLREYFYKIATAKVATSATEAFEFGFLVEGRDRISLNKNRLISDAKNLAISLAESGYVMPTRDKFKVLGRTALGMFAVGIHQMVEGGYATEYEAHMANKLAWVMAGGDLSEPAQVSEQYLLDLEREAFLHLCTQRKTLERIQHMLTTGKPLRN